MNKKLAVMLTIAAFGLAQVAPVAAQTSSNKPAQTSPKKNTTAKNNAAPKKSTAKKATAKKSTAPKKKTTKTNSNQQRTTQKTIPMAAKGSLSSTAESTTKTEHEERFMSNV